MWQEEAVWIGRIFAPIGWIMGFVGSCYWILGWILCKAKVMRVDLLVID